MTLRGPEDRSLRKSVDSDAVLGPWLTTRDEVPDPNDLTLRLEVNGELRQHASTRDPIFKVQHFIEYASSCFELYPGDLICTGTPAGVGPVRAGDLLTCTIERSAACACPSAEFAELGIVSLRHSASGTPHLLSGFALEERDERRQDHLYLDR